MFQKLFAESGLSLDRLKSLLEVGVAGSIVKAAGGDPVRQSQYSRQIKELEDFFRTKLVERQGKGMRLTPSGRELARISRFFMMGLSNFQRGQLEEEQAFRIGATATIIRKFLLPVLAPSKKVGASHVTEVTNDEEIERRLHDLTLDFGIVSKSPLSRPLQTRLLGKSRLELWVPQALNLSETAAKQRFKAQELPLVLAGNELKTTGVFNFDKYPAQLTCDSFLEARAVLEGGELAAILPDFLAPNKQSNSFMRVRVPEIGARKSQFYLAWNPRLLRLNPHAGRRRDLLTDLVGKQMSAASHP